MQVVQNSIQMTVERGNYKIAIIIIVMLLDWIYNLMPVFQVMKSKTKTNHTLFSTSDFSHILSKLQVIMLGILVRSSHCLLFLWLVRVTII